MTARGATSWGHMSHDVAEVGIDPGEMTGPGRPSYLKTEAKHSISFQGSENKEGADDGPRRDVMGSHVT